MVGVCFSVTDRDHPAMEQAEQVVIDLEELNRDTAWGDPSWKKPHEWAQRAAGLGKGSLQILSRKPNSIT